MKSDDALLRSYPEAVQLLTRDARQCIRRWLPDADEAIDVAARLIAYSHGAGYKGMVCTLILSKTGIKLGLVDGAALADSRGLLRGRGRVHRYVQLSKPEDLHQAGLKQLVLAASAACRKRLGSGQQARS